MKYDVSGESMKVAYAAESGQHVLTLNGEPIDISEGAGDSLLEVALVILSRVFSEHFAKMHAEPLYAWMSQPAQRDGFQLTEHDLFVLYACGCLNAHSRAIKAFYRKPSLVTI